MISSILKEQAHCWGKAGEWISILDATKSFFEAKESDNAVNLGLRWNQILIDGIHIRTMAKLSDLTIKWEEQLSSKQGTEYGRALN